MRNTYDYREDDRKFDVSILNRMENSRRRDGYLLYELLMKINKIDSGLSTFKDSTKEYKNFVNRIEREMIKNFQNSCSIGNKQYRELVEENIRLKDELRRIQESKEYKILNYNKRLYWVIRRDILREIGEMKKKIYKITDEILEQEKRVEQYIVRKMTVRVEGKIEGINSTEELIKYYNSTRGIMKYVIGRRVALKLKKRGVLKENQVLLRDFQDRFPKARFIQREIDIIRDKIDLLEDEKYNLEGVTHCEISYNKSKVSGKIKSLNVVNTSEPYRINGYGMRGKYIFHGLKEWGVEPIICTRPGFPNDYKDNTVDNVRILKEERENIKYYRSHTDMYQRYTPLNEYIEAFSKNLIRIAQNEEVDIIHAASNYVIGLAAAKCAEQLEKPFVYEIRGLWHITKLVTVPHYKNSEEFMLSEKMEVYLAKRANKVITISHQLKKWLINKGVSKEKIEVIPNGVNSKKIYPVNRNNELKESYFRKSDFVIGYIGTVTKLEGLHRIISAVERLHKEGYKNIKLMICGKGKNLEELKKKVRKSKVQSSVIFTGKIEHSKIREYYSIFDLCVYPREDEEVCRIVPPLKIIEAMACQKVILVSNLEALNETVTDGVNGFVFNNDVDSLSAKIKYIYEDKRLRCEIGNRARGWIRDNREWRKLTHRIKHIYDILVYRRNYESTQKES